MARYNPADKFNPAIDPLNDPNYLGFSRGVDIPKDMREEGVQPNRIQPVGAQIEGNKHIDRAGELAFRAQGLDYERMGVEAAESAQRSILGSKLAVVDIASKDVEARFAAEKNVASIKQATLGLQSQAIGFEGQAAGVRAEANMFATIAAAGDFVGKTAVTLVQKEIDSRIHAVVDKERGEFMDALQSIESNPTVVSKLSKNPDAEVPEELQNLEGRLDSLSSAYASGVIPRSLYLGRLHAAAKELRNTFPGMRDYIDAKFSRVAGVDPSNAYMASMVSNINRMAAAGAAASSKVETFYKQNLDVPNVDKAWAAYQAGKLSKDGLYSFVSQYKQAKESIQLDKMVIDNKNLKRTERETQYTDIVQRMVQSDAAHNFKTMTLASEGNTAQGAYNLLMDHMSGKKTMDPTQAQQLSGLIRGLKINSVEKIMGQLTTVDPETGTTMANGMGGDIDKIRTMVEKNHKVYDQVADLIENKDIGPAFSIIQTLQARQAQGTMSLISNKTIGPDVELLYNLNKLSPDFVGQYIKARGTDFLKISDDQLRELYKSNSVKFMTQPDLRFTGKVHSVQGAIDDAKKAGVTDPATFKSFVGDINILKLASTPTSVGLNIVDAYFDPQNPIRVDVNQFGKGGPDPNRPGHRVPGMHDLFSGLTNPEVTKRIWDLQQNDPERSPWDKYSNWAKETWARNLYGQEINDLAAHSVNPNVKIKWTVNQDGIGQFSMDVGKNINVTQDVTKDRAPWDYGTMSSMDRREVEDIRRSITRLNTGLVQLSTLAKQEGTDVSAYVLKTIIQANPNAINDVGSLPHAFAQAVASHKDTMKKAKEKEEEEKKYWNIR